MRNETLDLSCQDTFGLLHAQANLLDQIEHKARFDAFAQNLPVLDIGYFVDDQPDCSVKPFINIPVELCIYLWRVGCYVAVVLSRSSGRGP
jgi:hypothetical protein